MKITVPTNGKAGLDEEVAQHFGRCNTYTILDENGKVLEVIDNTSEHMGGSGLPPELMKKHGADILLCRDLGPRAIMLCNELGIEVFVGHANSVREMFSAWKAGELKKAGMDDACSQHSEHI
jgi:predicted Fe-Mo cluster-binding NifX family protein